MSKSILSPGRFLPSLVGTIIAHLINAAKVVETAFNDSNTQQLQRAIVGKRSRNNRRKTDGRKRATRHYC